jgi:hypothetical protein
MDEQVVCALQVQEKAPSSSWSDVLGLLSSVAVCCLKANQKKACVKEGARRGRPSAS